MKSDFKIILGIPKNGWLPVKIQHKEMTEVFYTSNIPTDPIGLLVDALFLVLKGRGQEIWWHLEPAGYFMEIEKVVHQFEITLLYSKDSSLQFKERIFKVTGNEKEIILPIWRALCEFYSHGYTKPAWPACDIENMEKLNVLIRELKS